MGIFSKIFGKKQLTPELRTVINDEDFIPRETLTDKKLSSETREIISTTLTNFSDDTNGVPPEIIKLLWFADGPLANYKNDGENLGSMDLGNGMSISFSMTGADEPSLISVKAPIVKPKSPMFMPGLSYFPSYLSMSPEQRWIYLNWLRDITTPIDIGYVFVFYYGLERHLFSGHYEDAFKTIVTLRKYQVNGSFDAYSNNALLAAMVYHNDDTLWPLFESSQTPDSFFGPLQLVAKYTQHQPLTAQEIVKMSSMVSFTNKRYIKGHSDIFLRELENVLASYYNTPTLPLDTIDLSRTAVTKMRIVANISLSDKEISILDIASNTNLQNTIRKLLQEAHDRVKDVLREARKKR